MLESPSRCELKTKYRPSAVQSPQHSIGVPGQLKRSSRRLRPSASTSQSDCLIGSSTEPPGPPLSTVKRSFRSLGDHRGYSISVVASDSVTMECGDEPSDLARKS